MPRVPIEQNRVGIAQVTDAKLRPADGFGSVAQGLGQGMASLGGAVAEYADTQDRLRRAQAELDYKDADNKLAAAADQALYDPNTGFTNQRGEGAVRGREAALAGLSTVAQKIGATLQDPHARRLFDQAAAQRLPSYQTVIDRHVIAEHQQWQDDTSEARINLNRSDAVNNFQDPERADQAIGTMAGEVRSVGTRKGWSSETIDSHVLDQVSATRRAIAGLLTDASADAGEAYLKKYAPEIKGTDTDAVTDAIRVKRAQDRVLAEHQAALVKADTRERLSLLQERIAAGEDVPDAELKAGEQLAGSISDLSGAYKIGVQRIASGVNRETKSWTPTQFDGEINRLRGLGEKRTADQDIRLTQIEKIAPSRTTEFNNNPGRWAALNGMPPPALSLSDPASISARMTWMASVSRATGRPTPPLTQNEVADFSARAAQSPAARVAVIDQIALFGGKVAVAAARQIAPQDAMMARMVLLRKGDRAAVANGMEARKAYPDLVDKEAGKEALTTYQERLGGATALLGQGDVAAAFEVARNLYADAAVKTGNRAFDASRFNAYIHRALGGTREASGEWHGGIGAWSGTPLVLPPSMSQTQFDTVMTRMTWPESDRNAPVYRNGTPMRPADIRKLTPVVRPDGTYEFHGADGHVATGRNGGVWRMDIEALWRKYHP